MSHLALQKLSTPDDYSVSQCTLSTFSTDGKRYFVFQRSGVTPPGYPDRAVYRCSQFEGYYVYDGGYLWECDAWRQFVRENGRTPAQAATP